MRKPVPEDFGITAEEYTKFIEGRNAWNTPLQVIAFVIAVIIGIVIGSAAEEPSDGFTFGFLTWLGLSIAAGVISEFLKRQQPQYRKAKLYREAEEVYRRTLTEHWMSLTGWQFEAEVGKLFKKLGYKVESTGASGDKGVDIVLKKDVRTTVVQCKAHKKPVGPAVVRELYGTMMASGADSAILVSSGGFTRGVRHFVPGKRIQLISSADLVTMAEEAGGGQNEKQT